jgi:hypothetical protein
LTERRALALCNLSLRMALLNVYRVQKRVNIFFEFSCGLPGTAPNRDNPKVTVLF